MSEESQTPSPDALIGSVLAGRYRILQKLGEGAMGAVYLGEHLKMGRQDAVKVLRQALSTDQEAIARFTRGARNVAAVQHPNVCTIYDYGDTQDGLPFLAMEFIPGESLKELLDREGRLPLGRAVHIAVQVAGALQAAHDAEIVHRDLKPANIMIMPARNDSDAVRVVDFDIAKGARDGQESELTRLGFVVGTPEYMSPEQLMGERLDGRSDLYSLGLVLFRMLTGTLPFRADSAQELMIQRLTVVPLPLSEALPGEDFPEGLESVLQRSLARRPTDRYAGAADFARDLQAACATTSVAAPVSRGTAPSPVDIPATRVSSAPISFNGAAEDAPTYPHPRSGRGYVGIAAIAAVVVLLAVGGFLWTKMSGAPDGAGETTRLPITEAPAVSALTDGAAPDGNVTTDPVESSQTLASNAAPSNASPPAAPPAGPTTQQTSTSATPVDHVAAGVAETPDVSGGGISISAAGATDLLWRQLDRIGPPTPSQAVLNAVRDSAQAVWDLDGVKKEDRAFAAYILGSTWYALGSKSECSTWIQRALTLRPDGPGYSTMLDNCRS